MPLGAAVVLVCCDVEVFGGHEHHCSSASSFGVVFLHCAL